MTPAEQIQEKISTLESLLESQLPGFKTVLRDIHTQLKKDEEIVTLLTEEEIAVICQGLGKQTSIDIITVAKKTTKDKPISKLTVDDL